jgi:hypothetical protein
MCMMCNGHIRIISTTSCVFYLFSYLMFFEAGSVAQVGLECQGFSCLYLLSAGIIGMHYYVQLLVILVLISFR